MNCRNECRWGHAATVLDGLKAYELPKMRVRIKAAKGQDKARLEALLKNQEMLCWSCGKRRAK